MMIDLLVLFLWLLPFFQLILVDRMKASSVFSVSASKLLLVLYLVHNHLGLLYLHFIPDFGYSDRVVVNSLTTITLLIYSNLFVLCFFLSRFAIPTSHIHREATTEFDAAKNNVPALILLFSLFCIPFLIARLDGSPLYQFVFHGADAVSSRLEDYVQGAQIFSIPARYIGVLFTALNFFTFLAMANLLVDRTLRSLIVYLIPTAIFLLWSMSNLSKGALLQPFICFLFVYSILYKNGNYLNRQLLLTFICLTPLLVWMTNIILSVEIDFTYIIVRALLGNLLPQYIVVDHFNFTNLLYGSSAPAWFSFGTHQQFNLEVFSWKILYRWQTGPHYAAPMSFIAEAHANFHFIGVIAFSMLAFIFLRIVDAFLSNIHNYWLYVGLLGWCSLHLSYISVTSLISKFVDYHFWGTVFIVYLASVLQRTRGLLPVKKVIF